MRSKEVRLEIPDAVRKNWQEIVDIMAGIAAIPACLIMRVQDPDIGVFVSSRSEGNPYHPGDQEHLEGSGLYCETVIKSGDKLLVPNALADEKWKTNPDIKLGMISYLGFPVLLPDKSPFGTICVLDRKENAYSESFRTLLMKFRDLVQADLELIYANQLLGEQDKRWTDYVAELQALRGIVTICTNCKSLKDEAGAWHPIERYLIRHPRADFSHGVCPECARKLYPEFAEGA